MFQIQERPFMGIYFFWGGGGKSFICASIIFGAICSIHNCYCKFFEWDQNNCGGMPICDIMLGLAYFLCIVASTGT